MKRWRNVPTWAALAAAQLPLGLLAQEVPVCAGPGSRDASWSPDGRSIAFTSNGTGNYDLWRIGVDGGPATRLTDSPALEFYPAFSPDGRRIAATAMLDDSQQVVLVDANGGPTRPLTPLEDDAADPTWLDDRRIVFSSARGGRRDLWIAAVDGTESRTLATLEGDEWAARVSPDRRRILFQSDAAGDYDLYTIGLDGTGLSPVVRRPGFDGVASWSPDGAHVAYYHRESAEGGPPRWTTAEIYTVASGGGESVPLTSNRHRDQSPSYSPDGSSIAYTSCASGNLEIWVLTLATMETRRLTTTSSLSSSSGPER